MQIVASGCVQNKLRANNVSFYKNQKFYDNIDDVYVVNCPRHPQFKDRFTSANVEMVCNCLNLKRVDAMAVKPFVLL